MRTRAERRYKRQVQRRKIKQFIKNCWYGGVNKSKTDLEDFAAKQSQKLQDHPAICSCSMCGNPRKWFKEKTLKEHMSELNLQEALTELGEFFLAKKANHRV